MSKLAAKDSHERRPFKPQIYKSRGQNRSYGQGGYQTGQIVETGDISWVIIQDRIIETTDLEETPEGMVDKIIEKITGMKGTVVTIEIWIGQEKELLQGIMAMAEIEAQAAIDLEQGLELVQIGIG